jgi:hypothetical protein
MGAAAKGAAPGTPAWNTRFYHIGDTRSTEETEHIAALGRDGWEFVAIDQGHIYRGVIAISADP